MRTCEWTIEWANKLSMLRNSVYNNRWLVYGVWCECMLVCWLVDVVDHIAQIYRCDNIPNGLSLFARNWFDVFKIIVYWPKNIKELRYTHSLLYISYVNIRWTHTHVSNPIHILCTRSTTSFAKYEKSKRLTKVFHCFPMRTHKYKNKHSHRSIFTGYFHLVCG